MLDRSAASGGDAPQRQPIFNIPAVVVAVLAVLIAIHIGRQLIPGRWDDGLFLHLAFVPGRLSFWIEPDRVRDAVVALARQGAEGYREAQAERFYLGTGSPQPWTMVGYALLHADTAHIALNGVWLLAFGTPVARRLGPWRFVALLVVTAWAGAVVYWALHPLELMPVIGASAAVSGCMGASLRFMFQPHVSIASLLEAGTDARHAAALQPARTLGEILRDRRALTFLVAWFVTNLLFGIGSSSFGLTSGPVAWEAHIGGFLTGLLLFPAFDPIRRLTKTDLAPSAPHDPAADP